MGASPQARRATIRLRRRGDALRGRRPAGPDESTIHIIPDPRGLTRAVLARRGEGPARACEIAEAIGDLGARAGRAEEGRQLDEGLRLARRATQLAPDSACNHGTLGEVCFRLGRHAEAVRAIRRAVELAPRDERFSRKLARYEAAAAATRPAGT